MTGELAHDGAVPAPGASTSGAQLSRAPEPSPESAASGSGVGDNPGPLVSVAWLAEHLGDSDLRLVHTSSEPEHYPQGHIPGAVFSDLHEELAERGTDPAIDGLEMLYLVPDRASVERALRRWGVGRGDRVVFCDDTARNRQAIRGLWLLRLYGFPRDRVHVLDGGITAWRSAGLSVTTEVPSPRIPNEPAALGPEDPSILATREQVAAWSRESASGGPIRILDVRRPEEFRGEELQARRGGHIPGAANLDWERFLNEDGTFRSPAEIRAIVATVTDGHPESLRAAHCQGGVRAAAAWFAISELAGIRGIRNYARSWEEWGNRPDTAIEA